MQKKLTIIIVCFYLFIMLGTFCSESGYILEDLQLNPNDYARITDMEYQAVVSDGGQITVTERLTFDVHAASRDNGFWELWRDLVEEEVDGLKVHYQVNSVKQILPDGTEIIYGESPRLYWEDYDYVRGNPELGPGKWFHSPGPYDESARRYECVFFYIDDVYREEMVFEIEYEMNNAALKYNDCSDLYLAMYSGPTIKYLNSLKAEILFPNDIMPSEGNYEVFTYGTDSHTFPVHESADRNPGYYTFYFELDEDDLQFHPYNQYVEIDIVAFNEDKHIFTENASVNFYTGDDMLDEIWDEQEAYLNQPAKAKRTKIIVFALLTLATAGILFYAFKHDRFIKKKHYFCDPITDIQYFREIPSDLDPNFAHTLVHCKHKAPKDDSGVYSAILLSLARKGYIELQEVYKDVLIKILKRPTPPKPPIYPSAGMNAGYSTVSQSVGYSTIDQSVGYPTVDQSVGYPTVDQSVGYSTVGQSAGYPTADQSVGYSTVGQSVGYPTVDQSVGYSAIDQSVGYSTTDQSMGYPTVGQSAGYPTVDQSVATPSASENDVYLAALQAEQEAQAALEPLTPCEEYYFNLIVKHAGMNDISMSTLQWRVSADSYGSQSFVQSMDGAIGTIGVQQNYFQKLDYKQPQKQTRRRATLIMILGILSLTVGNIVSYFTRMDLAFGAYFIFGIGCIIASVILRKKSAKYVLLTSFGEEEYAKWRGLYNFLNGETLMDERSFVEVELWEKYLIYATAFGISEKVSAAIGLRCPELAAQTSPLLRNDCYRSSTFRSHSRSFHSSVRSSGGGFGGGGFGYGGGGRGGGGGGGGH